MSENDTDKFSDYITFPRTFEKYRWYKPILVLIIGLIIYIILQGIIFIIFSAIYGWDAVSLAITGGYSTIDASEVSSYVSYLSVGIIIPAIYLASKIVRDRPFSSYSSSRGGWNWKLYFKCLTIPLAVYLIYSALLIVFRGKIASSEMTFLPLILCLIFIPMQCIAEEYLCRGFIMQTLGSWFKIPILAIILQAVFFAVMHPYDIIGVAAIFISGVILGVFAWKTHGLEAGSAYHSVNNLISFYLVAFGFDTISSSVALPDFAADMALTIISAALLYYIGTKNGWFEEKTSESKLI